MHHHAHHDHKHDHHHGHGHSHGASAGKLLWIAVICILLFAGIEAIAGWFAHSLALLSDSGHMLADALSLILAAVAAWIAQRPPSDKHSYGLGRAEVIAALLSSLFIFMVVVGIAVEAVRRLQSPNPVVAGTVMIVAGSGIVINIIVAFLLSRGEQTLNLRAALLHVIGDLLGSIAALLAGAVIYYTHWLPIDPILSLFICALILLSSLRLLRDTFLVLMEGVPPHVDFEQVGRSMAGVAKVRSVHDLHIWNLSSGVTVLSAHIIINDMHHWDGVLQNMRELLAKKFRIDHITLQPEVHAPTVYPLQRNDKPR